MLYAACRSNLIRGILALVTATLTPLTVAGQAFIETQVSSSLCPPPFPPGTPATPCPADSEAYAAAVQPDGKIVAVGRSLFPQAAPQASQRYVVTVVRYVLPFFDLDPSFGSRGIVQTPVGGGDSVAHAVAIQPDGKIVVGGGASNGIIVHGQSVNTTPFLLRYLPTGAPDPSFNGTGVGVEVDALAVQPDGSILAVGRSSLVSEQFTLSLDRFSATGSFAGTVGSIGPITPRFDCPFDCPVGNPLALGPDGSIVFGGGSASGGGATVARFLPTGLADPAFRFADGFLGTITAVAVQPDGKIVAGGRSANPITGYQRFTLARYLPTGALDPSFGAGGVVQTPVGASAGGSGLDNYVTALAVLPDDTIVAGGTDISFSDTYEFTVVYYDPAGVVEPFGIVHSFYGKGANSYLGAFALGHDRHSNSVIFATGPVYGSFLTPGGGVSGPFVFAAEEYGGNDANTFTGTNVAVMLPEVKPSFPVPSR